MDNRAVGPSAGDAIVRWSQNVVLLEGVLRPVGTAGRLCDRRCIIMIISNYAHAISTADNDETVFYSILPNIFSLILGLLSLVVSIL